MKHQSAGAGCVFALGLFVQCASSARAEVLYGGGGGGGGLDARALFTIDQTTGLATFIADPVTPGGLSGLAFSSTGRLYGSTVGAPGDSTLVLLDPTTGALTQTIGTIRVGSPTGQILSIGDLAIQPGS